MRTPRLRRALAASAALHVAALAGLLALAHPRFQAAPAMRVALLGSRARPAFRTGATSPRRERGPVSPRPSVLACTARSPAPRRRALPRHRRPPLRTSGRRPGGWRGSRNATAAGEAGRGPDPRRARHARPRATPGCALPGVSWLRSGTPAVPGCPTRATRIAGAAWKRGWASARSPARTATCSAAEAASARRSRGALTPTPAGRRGGARYRFAPRRARGRRALPAAPRRAARRRDPVPGRGHRGAGGPRR